MKISKKNVNKLKYLSEIKAGQVFTYGGPDRSPSAHYWMKLDMPGRHYVSLSDGSVSDWDTFQKEQLWLVVDAELVVDHG